MKNPWTMISLSDYENHMSYENVEQLQTLNKIMKQQIQDNSISSVMILGIAGGNGLNHITDTIEVIYGVDINDEYLYECKNRYTNIGNKLSLLNLDLTKIQDELPTVDLLIANLFIEYIGIEMFKAHVKMVEPKYISIVLQEEGVMNKLVSDTPYSEKLSVADLAYTKITDYEVTKALNSVSYSLKNKLLYSLPNGKRFVLLDFERN